MLRSATAFSSSIESALNRIKPGFFHICKRLIETKSPVNSTSPLVEFDPVIQSKNFIFENIANLLNSRQLDLASSRVVEMDIQDIELEDSHKYGQIFMVSKSDITVRYGDRGVSTSKSVTPSGLLKHELVIPSEIFGILNIQKHVPFILNVEDKINTFFMSANVKIREIPCHEENIKRYDLKQMAALDKKTSADFSKILEERILKSAEVESFFEEITAPISKPTKYSNSSTTGMIFQGDTDKTSPMHYHPGWRVIFIITTETPSGVFLNFCGVEEDPSKRTDSMVRVDFPLNSLSALTFPPYVHHKFFGKFVCTSDHPNEGPIFLKNYFNKKFASDLGFLEANTMFSKISNPENILEQMKWNISKPSPESEIDKSKSR